MTTPTHTPDPLAEALDHIDRTYESGITVGVNPPGLLREAVTLSDLRRPAANLAAAVFSAQGLAQLLANAPVPADFRLRAVNLSEELQAFASISR